MEILSVQIEEGRSFISKVALKKQLKSLGVYKIHAAPPIDIETPREAERKEKERKDALNKKAVEMMKPFFDKLETDFKDFAKTYVYAGCPITVQVAKDRNKISLNSLQWKRSPIELVEVRFWWKENAVKEPQLLWSAETKLSGGEKKEGGILYNYGEIEAYLSKVLNDSYISKPEK